jgi:putative transposase
MYRWRKLTADEQATQLAWRRHQQRPWHSPPHFEQGHGRYHITAACYEHAPILATSDTRIPSFVDELLATLESAQVTVYAWCVLPNHYHLLAEIPKLKPVLTELGRLHGRTSHRWNGEDNQRGRKVWSGISDRFIRSEPHFWATLNYIHHNPIKHGHTKRWTDWPFSSAPEYLEAVGQEEALHRWRTFPILDYGSGWDD